MDFAYIHSVVGVGIYRLKVLLDINAVLPDITWTFWPSQLWTSVELNVAVISGECIVLSTVIPKDSPVRLIL